MRDNDSYFDICFIFHPADIDKARRIAAQVRATGISLSFSEDEFGTTAGGAKQLKSSILRSYTVAFVMSPESAESQLCNELLQYAVSKEKRLISLILDDEIEVDVHPAIAQNPYVFFRENDDLAARVDELRAYLTTDDNLKLYTELLALAETWRERGRPPDLLLPPDRLDEARGWLASAPARHPKPSALQLEYVHSSRRQPPRSGRTRPRHIALGIVAAIAIAAGLLLLQRVVTGWQAGQGAGALNDEAGAQAALAAAATAANDSAVGLIDQVAATGAVVRTAVAHDATAKSITATAVAQVTQAAQARADIGATQMRLTEIAELERDEVARRLVQAGEQALERGNLDLALALAWEAKDGLDNPRSAHRLLRRLAATGRAITIDGVELLQIHPAGESIAVVPRSRDELHIYDGASRSRLFVLTDHEAPISIIAYSADGERLISAAEDGEIIIRDGRKGEPERRRRGHQGAVTALALDPEGRVLLSAGSAPLLVAWDLGSGEELAAYSTDDEKVMEIHDLVVTADGERVIGWYDDDGRTVMAQWSADTLDLLSADSGGRVYHGTDWQGRIGYSGGSSLPAYPGDSNTGDLILWDLTSGGQIARLTDGFNWSFLSGDSLAAATDDLLFVAFSEELALVMVNNNDTGQRANLVDIESGRLLRGFETETAALATSASFIDEGTILSATSGNRALLWSSIDGRVIREIGSAPNAIKRLQASPATDLVIAHTDDGAAHLWRLSAAAEEPLLTLHDALPGTSISSSGAAILLVDAESVSLRNVDSGETLVQLPASAVSHAGDDFAAYADGRLSVYNSETGAEARGWAWNGAEVTDLHLSPDGALLLAFSETNELWLARKGADAPQRLANDMTRPLIVRFAPRGDTILTMQEGLALLWDGEIGLARAAYPLGADAADIQAAFDASGESVIFFVQLEDGLAGLTSVEFANNEARRRTFIDVQVGALSSNGEHLSLVFSDGRIDVISPESGAVIHQIRAKAGELRKLQFLEATDTLLAAEGSDLILWDAEAGAADQRFAHTSALVDFSVSRDGARILTADESGAYQLWQVESAEELLARVAADFAPRELTCAERERYLVAPLCE